MNPRQHIDHELALVLSGLSWARQCGYIASDNPLAESIEAVRLQVADLFDLNHIRAMREQLAREAVDSMEDAR